MDQAGGSPTVAGLLLLPQVLYVAVDHYLPTVQSRLFPLLYLRPKKDSFSLSVRPSFIVFIVTVEYHHERTGVCSLN